MIKARMVLAMGVLVLTIGRAQAFSWPAISPTELKMTAESAAPGAPAIILDLTLDRDDADSTISKYVKIKILTEEGRKFANVEIPYEKFLDDVRSIEARTIHPDSKIVEFKGTIFDKLIVKGKGIKYQAKTFAMPDVHVGDVFEFHFVVELSKYFVYDSQWILSDELFIKHAKYSLKPNPLYEVRSTWPRGLPPGVADPIVKAGNILLEANNVAAFVSEDYMPPEDELKSRVDFVYYGLENHETEPAKFWQRVAKNRAIGAEEFMRDRKAMAKIVAGLVSPAESDETKLRNIYAHVQSLRNLSYEKRKTDQEEKRENIKELSDVGDLEKYRYGNDTELTYLFVALVRAAGFKSDFALISTRNRYFFQPGAMNLHQITSNVAIVTLNGKDIYVAPGVPFVPFGLLPWFESGVMGLRVNEKGDGWFKTTISTADQSKVTRKATFKLEDGSLVGTVVVTYTGLDALDHRLDEKLEDAAARKEYMQNELKRVITTGSEVTMTNSPDWSGADTPLVVEYNVRVPGWATAAGKRMLMPIGLFGADEKHVFEHEQRVHPIYFHYPATVDDDISIELPAGWQVTSMPQAHDDNIKALTFASSVENTNNVVKVRRKLTTNGIFLSEKFYLALRDFFQSVRSNDEEQIVLTAVAESSGSEKKEDRKVN